MKSQSLANYRICKKLEDYKSYKLEAYNSPIPQYMKKDYPGRLFGWCGLYHPEFSKEQHEVINQAMIHLTKRCPAKPGSISFDSATDPRDSDYSVRDKSLKQLLDDGREEDALYEAVNIGFWANGNTPDKNDRIYIVIDHVEIESEKEGDITSWTLGSATINKYNSSGVVHMKLNSLALGPDSEYSNSEDAGTWASTILHEMLHSFGWRHVDSVEDAFMVRFSDAIDTKTAFGLNLATKERTICGVR